MLKNLFLQFTLFLLAVCLLSACRKEEAEPDPNEVIIAENVSLISNEVWNDNFISIDSTDYTLTFSKDLDTAVSLKTGDIIVSSAGEGLLRKVTGVNTVGDQIEVQTEFASLVDAVEQGELDVDQPLNASQIKSIEYHVPGLEFKNGTLKNSSSEKLLWEINSVIYDFDKNTGTTNDQIKLVGDFSFNLNLVAKVKISFKGIKEIKFGIASSEKLNLNLVAQVAYELPDNLDVVLATIRFSPICIYMGVVPVVLNPVLKIHVGIDGNLSATLTTGISEELSFGAGIQYTKSGGWSPYSSIDTSFYYNKPEMYIDASITAYLKPEFEMKLYGVAGPFVNLKLYGRFDSELFPNPGFEIYGGISLGAGARIKIFNKLEVDYAIDEIFKYEHLLYKNYLQQPIDNPTVITSIGSFTSTTANIGGKVTGNGGSFVTERGVYWGTSPDPINTGNKLVIGSDLGSFSEKIQDLNPNTTYFVIAYATNSKGTAYGEEKNFTTLNNLIIVDVDGNIYNTITIGSQVWMKENLKTTRYSNGDLIGTTTPATLDISGESNPEYQWAYNGDDGNVATFGRLYTWYAATDARNICPAGWHVSSDTELKMLEIQLGMSALDADGTSFRGTNEGSKMAGVSNLWWEGDLSGSEYFGSSGFDAVPGGHRYYEGEFQNIGHSCRLFSSTENTSGSAWFRQIISYNPTIERNDFDKKDGFSIRCLKD